MLCLGPAFCYHHFKFNKRSQLLNSIDMNPCIHEQIDPALLSYNCFHTNARGKNTPERPRVFYGNSLEIGVPTMATVGPLIPNQL